MFEKITNAPPDPILGLADSFNADPRDCKINLGIGIYMDETGNTPILNTVKKAEQHLLDHENTKNYLGIDGLKKFAACTQDLLFGRAHPILMDKRARTAQTPGGTGALRIAADFVTKKAGVKRVWLSRPTWPNHNQIFSSVGLQIVDYDYYDAEHHRLNFTAMLNSLEKIQPGDLVLFHGCCHNPTGIDPTKEQWEVLAEFIKKKGGLPIFDFAYQGFGRGLEEDAEGLRIFSQKHAEFMVCSSYSKNFGLYNERVGACTIVAGDDKTAEAALSQLKTIIRATYSNPPAHGGAIVETILIDDILRNDWEKELTDMRQRIQRMRQLFVQTLKEKGANQDFSFIIDQKGMFSFSGLKTEQVLRLREKFGVYAVNSGRVNVAAMTLNNMVPLCEAIAAVI